MPVWPTLSLAECETLAAQNASGYTEYLEKLTDSGLASRVRYRNTKGDEYTNSVLDILTHVVIHGAYHRGQIARIIGRAGGQTPNTDYIAYSGPSNLVSDRVTVIVIPFRLTRFIGATIINALIFFFEHKRCASQRYVPRSGPRVVGPAVRPHPRIVFSVLVHRIGPDRIN